MLAAGCGGDDNGGGPNNGVDGGGDTSTEQPGDETEVPGADGGMMTTTDGGPMTKPDGSSTDGGDAGPTIQDGKLILVHAAMYAPGLRFCFGSVAGDAGAVTVPKLAFPLPGTTQGVPPGAGGPSPDQGDFSDRTIELYALDATKLTGQLPGDAGTPELNCAQLLGADGNTPNPAGDAGLGLVKNTDYWDLGTLPKGTLAPSTTTLAVVTGCGNAVPDAPTQLADCPGNQKSKLTLWYKTLDTTTAIDGGSIGAQFAYSSYPFASVSTSIGGSGSTALAGFYQQTTILVYPDAGTPDAGDAGGDAGDAAVEAAAPVSVPVTIPQIVAAGANYGDLKPATLASGSGLTLDDTSGFFIQAIAADGGSETVPPYGIPLKVAIPFPSIHDLSWGPGSDAGPYQNGTGYVFILLGDPLLTSIIGVDGGPSALDAGGFLNPYSAHILGFPTNPIVPKP